ncbi:MAG: hypothetical protein IT228_01435 [Flavobacteriales bacterium]|nr:hypothetical protein [Flavobacteriales bacterium]MCC6575976.1 hypothetical protein [Flavobacteriales bacterium]NUQ16724.1 hypothetical protein [Flavobacteriales bacterium]
MMEFLSDRVSVQRKAGTTTVVISPRLPRGQQALLLAWTVAWTCCGIAVAIVGLGLPAGRERSFALAYLAFWAYFEYRLVRVLLWRLKGFEKWRVKDGVLTVKDDILGFGRATDHFVENIREPGLLAVDRRSWAWQLNGSFWVMGGERIGFEHHGRKVALGKGLTEQEAVRLVKVLKEALRQARRPEGRP